jgi:hypothetical protein
MGDRQALAGYVLLRFGRNVSAQGYNVEIQMKYSATTLLYAGNNTAIKLQSECYMSVINVIKNDSQFLASD